MLVLPTACPSCGYNIGSVTLLFKYLIYSYSANRREALRIGEGKEMLLEHVSRMCDITNPCCWNVLQGAMTYTDVGAPPTIVTSKGSRLFGGNKPPN